MTPHLVAVPPAGTANPDWWMVYGACIGEDPDIWFPHRGESNESGKKICADCVVRVECLEHALSNNEKYGIWGGLSERERRKIKSARYRAQLASTPAAAALAVGVVPCVARDLTAQSSQSVPSTSRATQHP